VDQVVPCTRALNFISVRWRRRLTFHCAVKTSSLIKKRARLCTAARSESEW